METQELRISNSIGGFTTLRVEACDQPPASLLLGDSSLLYTSRDVFTKFNTDIGVLLNKGSEWYRVVR